MEDPQYVADLAKAREGSKKIAAARWKVVEQMEAIVKKAEAEGRSPTNDPAWAALAAENERLIGEIKEHNLRTQQMVRERIRKTMSKKEGKKK